MNVRVRGIYTTALTQVVLDTGRAVVQASPAIEERFEASFDDAPADVAIDTTADRQGIGLVGDPAAVADLRETLSSIGSDSLSWPDPTPLGAVCDGVVDRTRGGGAVVSLPGGAEGYLPFDAVDGYVDVGDRLRVQVRDPEPPWSDDLALLGTDLRVPGGLVTLDRERDGVSAAATGEDATELVRTTDLLSADAPDGWSIRWERAALDADIESLDTALDAAAEIADDVGTAVSDASAPAEQAPDAIATPFGTAWLWFGRDTRFALDDRRREVTDTMVGHHRIKAATEAASAAVDLVEAVCDDPSGEFPFAAVTRQFGPTEGDRIPIRHGKPDGRLFALGRGEVVEYDPEGTVTVHREMQSSGRYDALDTPREPGDVAITKLTEGRWWYPTVYRGSDGDRKGTYVNVCTPVELFPNGARYVDLHVDVIRRPDGTVERVDDDELAAAVDAGHLDDTLAKKARSVAETVERALS